MGHIRHAGTLSIVVLSVALLTSAETVSAAAYDVTRFDDPIPDACAAGDCSLREAVIAANADTVLDDIVLPPGTYTLAIAGPGDAQQGDLDITNAVAIKSPDATAGDPATIDANGLVTADRAIQVVDDGTTLKDVGVTGGVAPADGDSKHRGGGIRVDAGGGLSMLGGEVSANSAPDDASEGGGIYIAGNAVFYEVLIANNLANDGAGGFGGGIYNAGSGTTTNIFNSVLRENEASFGGAISGSGTYLAVNYSRLRLNRALNGAGVFWGTNPSDQIVINDSNLNGNIADGKGGAIRVREGRLKVSQSTIADNTAGVDGGGISALNDAGGVVTAVTIADTIVAENQDLNATTLTPDCQDESPGAIVSSGYNIVGNANGCSTDLLVSDQSGSTAVPLDPLINPPAFNGAQRFDHLTQSLLLSSPARNAGNPSSTSCNANPDSRGAPRNLGGNRCDIGAYELVKCAGQLVNRVGTADRDSAAAPELTPTSEPDGVLGLGRPDLLKGDGGQDGLCGGGGGDTLRGGGNDDVIAGEAGKDRLIGGAGRDVCIGGGGTDTAKGCEVKRSVP